MPFNGSGVFSLYSTGNPVITGTVISSAWANNTLSDLGTGLSTCVLKNGAQIITANIPMATFKFTGLGAGSALTDSASMANIINGTGTYVGTVGGTADVITLTPAPAITAYAAGQKWVWIASGANTTNVTVAISGLTARALTKNGSTALVANDIPSGAMVEVYDDGTRLQLIGCVGTLAGKSVSNTFEAGTTQAMAAASLTGQLTSTLATGTAPFVVTSTTQVSGLNSEFLNGITSAAFISQSTGSYTGTMTGGTTSPTVTIYYVKIGSMVMVSSRTAVITVTSNTTACTITGAPADIRPANDTNISTCAGIDGSASTTIGGYMSTAGTLTLKPGSAGSFTGSGVKGFDSGFAFSYQLV